MIAPARHFCARATGCNRDVRVHSPVRRAYRNSTFMVWSLPEASTAMIPVAPV
jgi:hypothetical protein